MHGVLDDAADVRIVEGTVRLVARLEIEDLAVAAGEGAAAAEDKRNRIRWLGCNRGRWFISRSRIFVRIRFTLYWGSGNNRQ